MTQVFAAVRFTEGREWVDTGTLNVLREEAEFSANRVNETMPYWASHNKVMRIAEFKLTEVLPEPTFEKYDVLQIDWGAGSGWQDFSTLKEKSEFDHAVRIVRGYDCPSHVVPHKNKVKWRIKGGDRDGTIKIASE